MGAIFAKHCVVIDILPTTLHSKKQAYLHLQGNLQQPQPLFIAWIRQDSFTVFRKRLQRNEEIYSVGLTLLTNRFYMSRRWHLFAEITWQALLIIHHL